MIYKCQEKKEGNFTPLMRGQRLFYPLSYESQTRDVVVIAKNINMLYYTMFDFLDTGLYTICILFIEKNFQEQLSKTTAIPWPPPQHKLTTPRFTSRFFIS